ncbi:MAG: SGNH/GDSL hydrolase family protein [Bacteroidia bacterium]|nr:SGNH/GDSL hydrolase family protein [Bacteroidia bacterium]
MGCTFGPIPTALASNAYTFDLTLQQQQWERFEKIGRLLTPGQRSHYGSSAQLEYLKPIPQKQGTPPKKHLRLVGNPWLLRVAPQVQSALAGCTVSWYAHDAGTTEEGAVNTDRYFGGAFPDMFLISIGQEDMRQVANKAQVPLYKYLENLRKIITRLKDSRAKVYFVTAVPNAHQASNLPDRDTISIYYAAALRLMESLNVPSLDLYTRFHKQFPGFRNQNTQIISATEESWIVEQIKDFVQGEPVAGD